MRPLLPPLVLDRRSRPACVHGIPQRLAGLEGGRGRGGDVQALAGPRIASRAGGAAPGAEGPEPDDPHILSPGQGFRDRPEHGVHRVPGRRPSDSGPAGHKARNLRLVHPVSPCVAEFSRQTIAGAGAHG